MIFDVPGCAGSMRIATHHGRSAAPDRPPCYSNGPPQAEAVRAMTPVLTGRVARARGRAAQRAHLARAGRGREARPLRARRARPAALPPHRPHRDPRAAPHERGRAHHRGPRRPFRCRRLEAPPGPRRPKRHGVAPWRAMKPCTIPRCATPIPIPRLRIPPRTGTCPPECAARRLRTGSGRAGGKVPGATATPGKGGRRRRRPGTERGSTTPRPGSTNRLHAHQQPPQPHARRVRSRGHPTTPRGAGEARTMRLRTAWRAMPPVPSPPADPLAWAAPAVSIPCAWMPHAGARIHLANRPARPPNARATCRDDGGHTKTTAAKAVAARGRELLRPDRDFATAGLARLLHQPAPDGRGRGPGGALRRPARGGGEPARRGRRLRPGGAAVRVRDPAPRSRGRGS